MPSPQVRVEGVEEAQKAFQQVARDVQRMDAAQAAGEALVPYVASLSRQDTGAMAAGWGVEAAGDNEAAFINSTDYWTYQEFGTKDILPMDAIGQAWNKHEDVAVEAYDKAIKEVAEEAGFEQ